MMEEHIKLAFEFASKLAIQLMTLATAILTLTITFTKDLFGGASPQGRIKLKRAWILYLVSILCGILSLMTLTGALAPLNGSEAGAPSGIGFNARLPAGLQILTFLAATWLIIEYGVRGLSATPPTPPKKEASQQQKDQPKTNMPTPAD